MAVNSKRTLVSSLVETTDRCGDWKNDVLVSEATLSSFWLAKFQNVTDVCLSLFLHAFFIFLQIDLESI